MRVLLSLILLVTAGISLIVLPEPFFGIPKTDLRGALRLWASSLRLFAIPLSLVLLSFTKNVLIKLAILCWGGWILLVTTIFFFRMQSEAPAITLYGKLFLAAVLILSLSVFLFSMIQFVPKNLKLTSGDNHPVNPS